MSESDSFNLEGSGNSESSCIVSESFWVFWELTDCLIRTGVSAGNLILGWGGPSSCGVSGWGECTEDLEDSSYESVIFNALSSLERVDFLANNLMLYLERGWFNKTVIVYWALPI